jgi:hypothetical protein
LALSRDPAAWFNDLVSLGFELAPLAPSILMASSFLPASDLRDPADRILAATARAMDFRLMTRDQRLLDYAAAGHLAAIACWPFRSSPRRRKVKIRLTKKTCRGETAFVPTNRPRDERSRGSSGRVDGHGPDHPAPLGLAIPGADATGSLPKRVDLNSSVG